MVRPLKALLPVPLAALSLAAGCAAEIDNPGTRPDDGTAHRWMRIAQPPDPQDGTASQATRPWYGPVARTSENTGNARIGRGFDSAREEWLGNCVEPLATDSVTGGRGQQVYASTQIVSSMEDVASKFDVSARVNLNFGSTFSGGLEFKLAQESNLSRYSTNAIVTVSVRRQEQTMNRYELRPWVIERLRTDPNFAGKAFSDVCGDGFASGFQTGGELVFLLSKGYESQQQRLDVEGKISAAFLGLVSAGGEVNVENLRTLKQERVTIRILALGTVAELPTLDDFAKKVSEFPVEVDRAGGWPISVRVSDYKLVENYPDLSGPRDQQAARVLKELSDRRTAVLPIHNDNVYIDLNKAKFIVDEAAHRDSLAASRAYLKLAEDAAIKCYEEERVCEVPAFPPMPRRPSAAATLGPEEYLARFKFRADTCSSAGIQEACDTGLGAAVCKSGKRSCGRDGDGSLQWGSCMPVSTECTEGVSRDCIADAATQCPGKQTFSRATGWGECRATMMCECRPGTTKSTPGACDRGAPAPTPVQACQANYRWAPLQCTAQPESCNKLDDDLNGIVDDATQCHSAVLSFTNVDTHYGVWLNSTEGDNPARALCWGGSSGTCDLSRIMAGRGDPSSARFIVKLINDNCFGSSGFVTMTVDGLPLPPNLIPGGPVHCGYFSRQEFEVDFKLGKARELSRRYCVLPTDCMY